jgi:hypothetical protein
LLQDVFNFQGSLPALVGGLPSYQEQALAYQEQALAPGRKFATATSAVFAPHFQPIFQRR